MPNKNREVELEAEIKALRARVSELESVAEIRREAEKTVRDQLQFLQILIDTIPNPIFFKDKDGKYLGCNKAFERRVGLTMGEIIGKSAFDLYPKELATRYEQHDSELFKRPGEKTYETRLTYPDGQDHDVIITKGIFTDSEGNVSGLVGVTLDITERKRGEKALQKAHDELESRVQRRTAALAEANSKLEKEVAERSRIAEELRISAEKLKIFAYSVAHDLKSPSVGIYGLARLLHNNFAAILGAKGAGFCDNIMKASEHVASLVDSINQFISTKETPLKIEPIDMEEVFRMLRDEFSSRLTVRQICLFEPTGIPLVRADKIAILRVFRNLIDNALKYGGDCLTTIELGYEQSDDFHHFTIRDDGVGIQAKDGSEIFNLFQRQNASDEIEGTGLGLAIVKEVVELHRGEVCVERGAEGGTVFHLSIKKDL
ncbi:putative PAS/PAC sensor signal transduction histidine kinase [Syntrophobacter sp. SbD1]|nr:putative PAS/PAC sensor signal transduction histidine kinase [Syntrophobacter sp. SbD1]